MPGKISEYSNNGNINNWDLLDYSHENEQGSGIWETRSITLAQLQTALGGGGGNNLAIQDQTLTGNRVISGNTNYKLEVEDVSSFDVKSNVIGSDFADHTLQTSLVQTSVIMHMPHQRLTGQPIRQRDVWTTTVCHPICSSPNHMSWRSRIFCLVRAAAFKTIPRQQDMI